MGAAQVGLCKVYTGTLCTDSFDRVQSDINSPSSSSVRLFRESAFATNFGSILRAETTMWLLLSTINDVDSGALRWQGDGHEQEGWVEIAQYSRKTWCVREVLIR